MMEKLDFLESYAAELTREQDLKNALREYKSRAASARSIKLDDMPHGSSGGRDLSDYVAWCEECVEKIEAQMHKTDATREIIGHALRGLGDPILYDVLYYRHIAGMSMSRIAQKMYVARRHVYRLYDKAFEQLDITEDAPRLEQLAA